VVNLILPKFFFYRFLISNYCSGYTTGSTGGSGTVASSNSSLPSSFLSFLSFLSFFSSSFGGVGTVGIGEALIGIFSSSVHS
jgi:hypothetical protein